MKNVVYIIYSALGIAMLVASVVLIFISELSPAVLGERDSFYNPPYYSDYLSPERMAERLKDLKKDNRVVTGDDYSSIVGREDIAVTMTIIELDDLRQSFNSRGFLTRETYTIIGVDESGFTWYIRYYRHYMTEPAFTDFSPGQSITVYGWIDGDYYYEELETRIPSLYASMIDY